MRKMAKGEGERGGRRWKREGEEKTRTENVPRGATGKTPRGLARSGGRRWRSSRSDRAEGVEGHTDMGWKEGGGTGGGTGLTSSLPSQQSSRRRTAAHAAFATSRVRSEAPTLVAFALHGILVRQSFQCVEFAMRCILGQRRLLLAAFTARRTSTRSERVCCARRGAPSRERACCWCACDLRVRLVVAGCLGFVRSEREERGDFVLGRGGLGRGGGACRGGLEGAHGGCGRA